MKKSRKKTMSDNSTIRSIVSIQYRFVTVVMLLTFMVIIISILSLLTLSFQA